MLDSKLYTFQKVVETESYTLAAHALHMTQPAVTQHIKKLEDYYGLPLIYFKGHQMHLTPEGRHLYHYTRLQMSNEQHLLAAFQQAAGALRIGATLSIADYFLPGLLSGFFQEHTGRFSIQVGNTEEMLTACLNGDLDFAFIEGMFDKELFEAHQFTTADFCGVVAAKHPLIAGGIHVCLNDLFPYPLVLREKGSGTRAILENFLFLHNTTPESFAQLIECGSFGMIKALLGQTNSISFMYKKVAEPAVAQGSLACLELEEGVLRRPLHFVYVKNSIRQEQYEHFYNTYVALGAAGAV